MTGMLIAGERTEGAAGEGIDVVDPATEEKIESVPRGTAASTSAAVPRGTLSSVSSVAGSTTSMPSPAAPSVLSPAISIPVISVLSKGARPL